MTDSKTIDVEGASKLLRLRTQRQSLKDALGVVEKEIEAAEKGLIESLLAVGLSSITIANEAGGESLVFLRNRKWAVPREGVTRQDIARHFDAIGHSELVTVNAQTLTAFVVECAQSEHGIPQELAAMVELRQEPEVAVRKK